MVECLSWLFSKHSDFERYTNFEKLYTGDKGRKDKDGFYISAHKKI